MNFALYPAVLGVCALYILSSVVWSEFLSVFDKLTTPWTILISSFSRLEFSCELFLHINRATCVFFLGVFSWYISFHPFTFSLFVSIYFVWGGLGPHSTVLRGTHISVLVGTLPLVFREKERYIPLPLVPTAPCPGIIVRFPDKHTQTFVLSQILVGVGGTPSNTQVLLLALHSGIIHSGTWRIIWMSGSEVTLAACKAKAFPPCAITLATPWIFEGEEGSVFRASFPDVSSKGLSPVSMAASCSLCIAGQFEIMKLSIQLLQVG